jgi:hypothetical protein
MQETFDVMFYQFPDYLERTFLHNRTAGFPRRTMVSVVICRFLLLVLVSLSSAVAILRNLIDSYLRYNILPVPTYETRKLKILKFV